MRQFGAILCTLFVAATAGAEMQDPEIGDLLRKPEVSIELDQMTRAQELPNRVELLHLGMRSKPVREQMIRDAKEFLFISVPYWFGDVTGRETFDLIRGQIAANPGLDFRVLMDWSSPVSVGDPFEKGIFKEIKKLAEKKVLLWNRPLAQRTHSFSILKERMHDKMMVADGRKLLMGGLNIGDEYLDGGLTAEGWHDTDMLIEGPAAQQATALFTRSYELSAYWDGSGNYPVDKLVRTRALQNLFYLGESTVSFLMMDNEYPATGHSWPQVRLSAHIPVEQYQTAKYFPSLPECPECTTPVRLIHDDPTVDLVLPDDPYYSAKLKLKKGSHYSKIMTTFHYLASHAKRTLRVFVPYLTPHQNFLDDLKEASLRGVEVSIITNSEHTNDLGQLPYIAGVGHYRELLAAGVHLYEWQGHAALKNLVAQGCTVEPGTWPGQTIHTKAVVFDDQVMMIGSHNFNERSQNYNKEIMALVNDPAVSHAMSEVFDLDLNQKSGPALSCSGGTRVTRPSEVEEITLEILNSRLKAFEKRAKLLDKFQNLF